MKKVIKNGMIVLTAGLIVASVLTPHASTVSAAKNTTPVVASQTEITSFSGNAQKVSYSLAGGLSFKDVTDKHWAHSAIQKAVQKTYVKGYPDGTFKPDQAVTRGEFIKMAVSDSPLSVKPKKSEEKWYVPFVVAAKGDKWITAGDYPDGNFTKPMTRMEMAKMAVKSLGLTAKNDDEYMLLATQKGIIHGMNGGQLYPDNTTTRAQSIVVVERLWTVRNGGTVKPDEKAIQNAQTKVEQKEDAWGNKIRTTNLPKNHADYPYILEYMPNEAYEMGKGPYDAGHNSRPIDRFSVQHITKANLGGLKKNAETMVNLILNVDYRTIDYTWATKLFNSQDLGYTKEGKDKYIAYAKEYVDWVKANKVITKGAATAEPSTARAENGIVLKVYYEYEVVSANKGAISWTGKSKDSIFYGQTREHGSIYSSNYKLGTKVKVVSEVEMARPRDVPNYTYSDYKPNLLDLSKNFVVVK